MNEGEKRSLQKLAWIANLSPETCPGGGPGSEREWRNLVNKIVREVKRVVAEVSDTSDPSDSSDPCGVATASPDVAANTLLCLINQAIYLLKRQIEFQEKSFLDQGGFTERLYHVRSAQRDRRPAGTS